MTSLLVDRLAEAANAIVTTERVRQANEALFELTNAYVGLATAVSFAKLGDAGRAREVATTSNAVLAAHRADPVHDWFVRALTTRIDDVIAQRPSWHWFSSDLRVAYRRHEVEIDRFLAVTPMLETGEGALRIRARQDDFVEQPAWQLMSVAERVVVAEALLDEKTYPALQTCLAIAIDLPESEAMPILVRALPLTAATLPLATRGIEVAARFGWGELVQGPLQTLTDAIAQRTALAPTIASALFGLRRLGMREELAGLLDVIERDHRHVKSGFDPVRALVGGALDYLGRKRFQHTSATVDHIRWLAHAYAISTTETALHGARILVRELPRIPGDYRDQRCCHGVLHFTGSICELFDRICSD